MEKKEKEVAEEYVSSLADLNLNSKPLINMLTILAEENIEYAPIIVKAVEEHIAKVNADVKLPVLYLIDSIVKNVGGEYIQLFSHCFVKIFCGVFEQVNEKVREKMYTLRQTWNDVFTPQKLYTLDIKVNCMDPNWPITAKVVAKSPSIHVNPNFLKKTDPPKTEMEAKLIDKQRQILQLQKRKLELQLAATKQQLEEQEKQLTMQTESVKPINSTGATQPVQPVGLLQQYKGMHSKLVNALNTPNNISGIGNTQLPKPRVLPVSSTMLAASRHRDPRLARQQLISQQAVNNFGEKATSSASTVTAKNINPESQSTIVSSALKNSSNENAKSAEDKDNEKTCNKVSKLKSGFASRDKQKSSTLSTVSSDDTSKKLPEQLKASSSSSSNNSSSLTKLSPDKSNKSSVKGTSSSGRNRTSRASSNKSSSNSSGSTRNVDKDPRLRQNSSERKKNMKSTSNSKGVSEKNSVTKYSERLVNSKNESNLHETTSTTLVIAKLTNEGENISTDQSKFPEIKESIKSRNYVRRNRDISKSPIMSTNKDSDLRLLPTIDKRSKEIVADNRETAINITGNKMAIKDKDVPVTVVASSPIVSITINDDIIPENLEKNLETGSCMDVDLRQIHISTTTSINDTKLNDEKGLPSFNTEMDIDKPSKKRTSTDSSEEPISKKSKSEKIDTLFGPEDVDLRTLNSGMGQNGMPIIAPPPPIISRDKDNWSDKKEVSIAHKIPTQPKRSNLDDVRAKLANATSKDSIKNKLEAVKQSYAELNEDSGDGTDANIRTIMSQAQELLYNQNINSGQFTDLVKTVIQINETSKLKEAKRRESLLVKPVNNLEDLTPISDEEEKFSSDEDSKYDRVDPRRKKFKAATIANKNIKPQVNEIDSQMNPVQNQRPLTLASPVLENNTNSGNVVFNNERKTVQGMKNDKRGRQRETKWSSPWDQHNLVGGNSKLWMHTNNHRLMFPQKPNQRNQLIGNQNRNQVPSPWQNPPPLIFSNPLQMPPISQPQINVESNVLPAILTTKLSNSVDNPNSDVMRTLNIDSVTREIRFYDDVAIAFMDWNQPKEIRFQAGQRRIIIDDRDKIALSFNDDYKQVSIDGNHHIMRFGCPTRELYIDHNWYECYFGDPPLRIFLDGRIRVFQIEGPSPQVCLGNLRQDLVVAKINLIIDAQIIVPVFLDAKLQIFEVDGKKHTLQFADYLKTVVIDNEPYNVEYGGLPKSMLLGGVKRFIRFSTLPSGIIPGKIFVKNMIRTELNKDIVSPPPPLLTFDSLGQIANVINKTDIDNSVQPMDIDTNNRQTSNSISTNEIIKPQQETNANAYIALPQISNINIDDLFQKLLASGILNPNAKSAIVSDDDIGKVKEKEEIKPIDLSKAETLKTRQNGIVQKLFSGMQCSSCGVRFPPEQTMKYSQHLDWHFRQNRRERDSARKAHSRKWYYDVSDWLQYEEIEDLDDREKNWFETQQNELENTEETTNQKQPSPPPSCAAAPDDLDKVCDICHDKFDQFYNEESEEWHLRSAIRVEDKTYHPLCYEDYKASLAAAASEAEKSLKSRGTEKDENDVTETTKIKIEIIGEDEEGTTNIDDDDDDVIVVPMEEPIITEIPDDDDDDEMNMNVKSNLETANADEDKQVISDENETGENISGKNVISNESMESDVEIQEPHIPFTDLDTYDENQAKSVSTIDDSSQSSQLTNIKIKEEPKYEGYEDDAFEDVGTFITADDLSQSIEEYIPKTVGNTLHDPLVASIDGNMEVQDTQSSMVVGVNKIKINITNVTQNQKNSDYDNENSINARNEGDVSEINNSDKNLAAMNENNLINKGNMSTTNNDKSCFAVSEINDVSCVEITYKPEMQGKTFEKVPKVKSGFETSGLCSIM